jgi:hypothetical protein
MYDLIIEKIANIQSEIGYSHNQSFFELLKLDLKKVFDEKKMKIDVLFSERATPVHLASINDFISNPNFTFNKIKGKTALEAFPQISAPILLIFFDNQLAFENRLFQILSSKKDFYKKIYFIKLEADTQIQSHLEKNFPYLKTIFLTLSDNDLETIKTQIFSEINPEHQNYLQYSKNSLMSSVYEQINGILKQEVKITNAEKFLLGQDTILLKKQEGGSNSMEINNLSRQILVNNLQETEKGLKLKYEDLNKPNYGVFSTKSETLLNSLDFNDFHRNDIASKYESIEVDLKKEVLEDYLEGITKILNNEFSKDLQFIKDVTNNAVSSLNAGLSKLKFQNIDKNNLIMPTLNFKNIIDGNVFIQRPYKGEITKEGRNEYFIALRDYTGIIMVIVGLLMPINLAISGVDIFSDGSNKTNYNQMSLAQAGSMFDYFMVLAIKTKKGVQFVSAIIAMFMIVYGIVDLRKRIPKKRIEEQEREILKQKDNLRQEFKRIFNDSTKDWTGQVSNYFKELSQSISLDVDNITKNSQKNSQEKSNAERQQQMLNQQAIELKLRSLTNSERTLETLNRANSEQINKLKF